jgi:hypothetical protein
MSAIQDEGTIVTCLNADLQGLAPACRAASRKAASAPDRNSFKVA